MMTLAERLRELAKQADAFARIFGMVGQGITGIKAELHAQQLRMLADEVEGKVLVPVYVGHLNGRYVAENAVKIGFGRTSAEALADLQRKLKEAE